MLGGRPYPIDPLQRVHKEREAFEQVPPAGLFGRLVFLDASGYQVGMTRLHARSPPGLRSYGSVLRIRGRNPTLLAGLNPGACQLRDHRGRHRPGGVPRLTRSAPRAELAAAPARDHGRLRGSPRAWCARTRRSCRPRVLSLPHYNPNPVEMLFGKRRPLYVVSRTEPTPPSLMPARGSCSGGPWHPTGHPP